MRFFQTPRASATIISALLTSLLTPQNLQLKTAQANLFLPDHNVSSSPLHPNWQHNAWEHWDTTGLDPEHAPYPVVFIGENLQNIAKNDISNVILASINTWNNIDCANPQLKFAGFRNSLDAVSKNEIPIFVPDAGYWHDQENLIASTNMNNPAIALNTASFIWSLEPSPFQYLHQNLNDSTPSSPLMVDLQSVLTHELGHILGLWHTQDDATATMTAKYLPDASQRNLAADDKFAICHLYPKPGNNPECTEHNDCPQGPCLTDGTFLVCQKHQANLGDYCALDLLHCPQGCIIDSPPTGTGYCTQSCQTSADCPSHFECKTHKNQTVCLIIRPEAQQTAPDPSGCVITSLPAKPRANHTPLLALLAVSAFLRRKSRRSHPL